MEEMEFATKKMPDPDAREGRNFSTEIGDLRGEVSIEFFKASGPGGQNVNKRNTAVRLTHRPSGIIVVSREERSQLQNKKIAFERLQQQLIALNTPKTVRESTQVPSREKENRLREKKHRSGTKEFRKHPEAE